MRFFHMLSKQEKILFILAVLLTILLATILALRTSNQQTSVSPPSTKQQQPVMLPPVGAYVPDELTIQYKAGNSPQELEEAIAKRKPWEVFNHPEKRLQELEDLDRKAGVLSKEKVFPDTNDETLRGFYLLKLTSGSDLTYIQKLYLDHDFITTTEPNLIYHAQAVPNDTLYPQMWGLKKINMEQAWDITKGSNEKIVAIIDTGVDYTHSDFEGRTIIKGRDYINNDDDPMDDNGHGTHVAGTIGAISNNQKGVAGVNWNVKLLAIKLLDSNGESNISPVAAIRYAADNDANIINMSIEGEGIPCASEPSVQAAIQYALNKNVVVVAAAGNKGRDAATTLPASCSGVIAVGATDQNDQRAIFTTPGKSSNYGSVVALGAPGKDILSTWLGNRYQNDSGTSMAAPHVSGAAALLLAKNPSLTPSQVRACLVDYADPISTDRPIGPRLNVYNSLLYCSPPAPTPTPTAPLTPGTPTPTPFGAPTATPRSSITPTSQPTSYSCQLVTTTQPGTQLQLQTLECTPNQSSIDFSASTLDWEDVKSLLVRNNLLSGLGSCIDELNRAVEDEVGVAGHLSPPASDSRIGLCWQNRKCIEQGYSAYDGSVPLPSFAPLPPCQEELRNAFRNITPPYFSTIPPAGSQEAVSYDVFNSNNTNCDRSDLVCVDLATFCSILQQYPTTYSSYLSICY